MNSFYEHHKDNIRFHYRCFDRVLLNGLIQPFQEPKRVIGFFNTYLQLYPVSRQVLGGIADRFQQWLKASTIGNGAACSCAFALTCHSQSASTSINITGWQTGCVRRASTSVSAPMPS
jgi:hypothetical protein